MIRVGRTFPMALAIATLSRATSAAPDRAAPSADAASAPPSARAARPRVTTTIASESSVTVVYSRPMRHTLGCGTKGFGAGRAGTIDGYETNVSSRYYTSTDPDFDEMWSAAWEASLNGDCSAVTFTFVHGTAPGSYPLQIARVQDESGNSLEPDPTTVTVTVVDSAPPG